MNLAEQHFCRRIFAMKGFLKHLTMSAATVVLIAGFTTGSAGRAYAQGSNDADAETGSWSAPGAGSADEAATPDSNPIPLAECWDGDIEDKIDGLGGVFFFFDEVGDKITGDSDIGADWSDEAEFEGDISGKVTSKGITFHGNAGKGCHFNGSAKGDDTELGGKMTFSGKCGKFFKHVRFSISPTGCI
jgi:hypothetical protein